jgi:type VI secretion system protein ImpI
LEGGRACRSTRSDLRVNKRVIDLVVTGGGLYTLGVTSNRRGAESEGMPLLARVERTNGAVQRAGFTYSPVRIGRNQLNELWIDDPAVSQWHALVRFDEIEQHVVIMDLGSTNGTALNGVLLHPHVASVVGRGDTLSLGPIRLNMSLASIPPELLETTRDSSFDTSNLRGSATRLFQSGSAGKTMLYQSLSGSGGSGGATMLYNPQSVEPTAFIDTSKEIKVVSDAIDKTRPAYHAYRQAWAEVSRQLKARLESAPTHLREHVAIGLKLEFPQLAKEPEFLEIIKRLGLGNEADTEVDPEEWLHRLKHGSSQGAREEINTKLAMERVGVILESFAESFLALRRGYEQFGEEMALRVVREQTPLTSASDHHEVLRVLLDWNADGSRAVEDLKRAFADLAIHQVALLHGFVEGVRHLFTILGPETVTTGRAQDLTSTHMAQMLANSAAGGFPFFRQGRLWKTYQRLHRALGEEDRFTREVFGRAFARAYFSVTGSQVQSGPEGSAEIGFFPGGGTTRGQLH